MKLFLLFALIFICQAEELILTHGENEEGKPSTFNAVTVGLCTISGQHSSIKITRKDEMLTVERYTGKDCSMLNNKITFNSTYYSPTVLNGIIESNKDTYSKIDSIYIGKKPKYLASETIVKDDDQCSHHNQNILKLYYCEGATKLGNIYFRHEMLQNNVFGRGYYSTPDFQKGTMLDSVRDFDCNKCHEGIMYECASK